MARSYCAKLVSNFIKCGLPSNSCIHNKSVIKKHFLYKFYILHFVQTISQQSLMR